MKIPSFPKISARRGFTLTELLVVVAIMIVLAAMVFVVARKGIEKANAATCMANLRQVGIMMNGAAGENNGLYPHGGPPHGWIRRLCAQLDPAYPNTGGPKDAIFFEEGAGEIFMCPADKDGRRDLHKSYLANPWVVGVKTDEGEWLGNGSFSPRRVPSIQHPGRVFLVVEDWTRDSKLWRGNGLRYKGNFEKDDTHPAHGGGRHFLYVDGHMDFLTRDPGRDGDGYDIHYRAK